MSILYTLESFWYIQVSGFGIMVGRDCSLVEIKYSLDDVVEALNRLRYEMDSDIGAEFYDMLNACMRAKESVEYINKEFKL